jgi:hypothetical protein
MGSGIKSTLGANAHLREAKSGSREESAHLQLVSAHSDANRTRFAKNACEVSQAGNGSFGREADEVKAGR